MRLLVFSLRKSAGVRGLGLPSIVVAHGLGEPNSLGIDFSGHAQCSNLIGHCNFLQLNQQCRWLTNQTSFSAVVAFTMKGVEMEMVMDGH